MVSEKHEILMTLHLKYWERRCQSCQGRCDNHSPSGMMDGMVGAIRRALDDNDFKDTP